MNSVFVYIYICDLWPRFLELAPNMEQVIYHRSISKTENEDNMLLQTEKGGKDFDRLTSKA